MLFLEKMETKLCRYNHVEDRKKEGAHYTPKFMADFMSNLVIDSFKDHQEITVVDPAVGDGALLVSFVESVIKENPRIKSIKVLAYDLNVECLLITRTRLQKYRPLCDITLHHIDFIEAVRESEPIADLVITNPPYVRTQNMDGGDTRKLNEEFSLSGYTDLYQPFLLSSARILKDDGILCSITSNRFLTIKSAALFRQALIDTYDIHGLWDFGDTGIFDAAVLPIVMKATKRSAKVCNSKNNTTFFSLYKTDSKETPKPAHSLVDCLGEEGLRCVGSTLIQSSSGYLGYSEPKDVWTLRTNDTEEWLNTVHRNTFILFRDVGKVRVGVKSNADKIFISKDWAQSPDGKPELARPLITRHAGGRYNPSQPPIKSIIYPHRTVNGQKTSIPLETFPITESYLNRHKAALEKRTYLINAGRNWWELWVPQSPDLWKKPKIVFRDIVEQPTFWADMEGHIVNGECYWMIVERDHGFSDMIWLILGIANSTFIERYYDSVFNNKLYGNKRRFISQYVERFPIPNPHSKECQQIVSMVKKRMNTTSSAKQTELELAIDAAVEKAFLK